MEDGRTPELRRMMVEYGEHFWRSGWAPLYGVFGGNPLAAMPSLHFATSVSAAHVLAETGAPAGALGWTYTVLLGIALVYLGEHYVVDLMAGLALAEGVRAGAPAADAARRAGCPQPSRRSRRGRWHEGHGRPRRAPLDEPSSAPLEAGSEPEDDEVETPPRLQFTARNVLVLGGFLVASIAALYYLLPQLAGLDDTWHRIEDGSPYWMFLALAVHGRDVRRLRDDVPRRVRARRGRGDRIGWRESYQITMAGLAASRIFAAGGAGGLVLTAWALRRAGMAQAPGGRQDALVPDPHLLPVRRGADRVRAAACGSGCSPARRRSASPSCRPSFAVIALAIGLSIALVPTDLQRRLGGWARSGGRLGADRAAARQPAGVGLGRHARRARARALARPGAGRRVPVLGLPDPRAVGGVPRVRRLAAAPPCSCRRSSSACSATCCRCRAASAASRAA